jgi:TPR repeat protein
MKVLILLGILLTTTGVLLSQILSDKSRQSNHPSSQTMDSAFPIKRAITDSSGRKVDASILGVTKESIRLQRASDGKIFDLPLRKLSESDYKFAINLRDNPKTTKSSSTNSKIKFVLSDYDNKEISVEILERQTQNSFTFLRESDGLQFRKGIMNVPPDIRSRIEKEMPAGPPNPMKLALNLPMASNNIGNIGVRRRSEIEGEIVRRIGNVIFFRTKNENKLLQLSYELLTAEDKQAVSTFPVGSMLATMDWQFTYNNKNYDVTVIGFKYSDKYSNLSSNILVVKHKNNQLIEELDLSKEFQARSERIEKSMPSENDPFIAMIDLYYPFRILKPFMPVDKSISFLDGSKKKVHITERNSRNYIDTEERLGPNRTHVTSINLGQLSMNDRIAILKAFPLPDESMDIDSLANTFVDENYEKMFNIDKIYEKLGFIKGRIFTPSDIKTSTIMFDDRIKALKKYAESGESQQHKMLAEKIDAAKSANPESLFKLSLFLNTELGLEKIIHTKSQSFTSDVAYDFLLFSALQDHAAALEMIFLNYKCVYYSQSYDFINYHAEKGNFNAMYGLSSYLLTLKDPVKMRHSSLKEKLSGHPNLHNEMALKWLDKAALLNDNKPANFDALRGIAYLKNNKPELAYPHLVKGASKQNIDAMEALAQLYTDGNGCEVDLKKARELYESCKGNTQSNKYDSLIKSLKERIYRRGEIVGNYKNTDYKLEIYGSSSSDKAVVFFFSSTQSLILFTNNLDDFQTLFDTGWNIVIIHRPRVAPFTNMHKIETDGRKNPEQSISLAQADFTGFGLSVVSALRKDSRYNHLHLVGNSLGAGAMAWDIDSIRKDGPVGITWISPSEMFLPPISQIEKLKDVDVISMPNDIFVRDSQLKAWIQRNAVSSDVFGQLPNEHLYLGKQVSFEKLSAYLAHLLK